MWKAAVHCRAVGAQIREKRAEHEATVAEHCTALSTRGASCVVRGLGAKIALSKRAVLSFFFLITSVVGYLCPRATRALRHYQRISRVPREASTLDFDITSLWSTWITEGFHVRI